MNKLAVERYFAKTKNGLVSKFLGVTQLLTAHGLARVFIKCGHKLASLPRSHSLGSSRIPRLQKIV